MLTSYFNTGPLILNMLEFAACIVMYIVFLQLDNDSSFFDIINVNNNGYGDNYATHLV